jgi:hypothetical protein
MSRMYPTNPGRTDRVPFPNLVAAASLAIGLPVVTAGVLIAALFSPELWTSVALVMLLVFALNLANILLFLGAWRARVGPQSFLSVWSIGAVFSGVCASTVLVLGGFFASLGG